MLSKLSVSRKSSIGSDGKMEKLKRVKNRLVAKITGSDRVRPFLVEFPEFFVSEKILKWFGFGYFEHEISERAKKWRQAHLRLFIAASIIVMILLLISLAIQPFTSDLVKSSERVASLFGLTLNIVRVYVIFFLRRKQIRAILTKLENFFPTTGLNQDTFETRRHLRVVTWILVPYAVFFTLGLLNYCFAPAMNQTYGFITDAPQNLTASIDVCLPFDQTRHGIYEVKYAMDTWTILTCGIIVLATDLFLCSLLHVSTMLYESLAMEFEVKEYVEHHVNLLEITDDLSEIFSPFLLIDLLATIFCSCVCAFLSVVSSLKRKIMPSIHLTCFLKSGISIYHTIRYGPSILMVLFHFFMNCYFVERVNA